ncbi:recombinase family protein [Paenibacillus sp. FSL H7-0735]|uniref:recombinase family protein n=1 Tax=Paenibacillus sp. FSL H7-0735 TaxID=2954736 RepID=UPI0030FC706F
MKTALYVRHSIDQKIQKTSLRSQIAEGEITAFKNKLFIDERYLDPKVSARNINRFQRPELHRLLSDIQAGIVQNVIVSRRCRLARNLSEHLEIYEILKKHKINVIFSEETEPPMIYSEEGEILEAIFGAKNELEGDKIVEGAKAGKRAIAKKGGNPGGQTPYGYRIIKTEDKKEAGAMIKQEEEVVVIRNMFNVFLAQNFKSFANYVKYLKSQHLIPQEWGDSRVRGMFGNQYYNGYLRYGDVRTAVPHLRIFKDEDWNKIQEKFASYSTGRKNAKHNVVYLLKDKITCSLCGGLMSTQNYSYKGVEGLYVCKKHGLKLKKNEVEGSYLQAAKEYLLHELPLELEKQFPKYVTEKTSELESRLFQLEFDLSTIGSLLITQTRQYMLDKSNHNKDELKKVKRRHHLIQEDISCIKGEIERFKGMVQYAASPHLKAAEFALESRLSELARDELIRFLITMSVAINADSKILKIIWSQGQSKYTEVEI